VEGAGAHAHVIGLQDQAALGAPKGMEAQDHFLERKRAGLIRHGHGLWRMGGFRSTGQQQGYDNRDRSSTGMKAAL
jgi:hypothetical protein